MKLRISVMAGLAAFWLVPFLWAGWLGRLPVKIYPRLSFQYNAAGLFTRRTGSWAQMLIQLQTKGSEKWKTLDTSELSLMGAFGYRQRIDRILQETHGRKVGDEVRQRLAGWVATKYEVLHPELGGVNAVRIGQMVWPVNTPEMAQPAGHWVADPPVRPASVSFIPLASFAMDHGKTRLIGTDSALRPVAPMSATSNQPRKL